MSTALTILGTGTARGGTGPVRNGPSFYADPVAWLMVEAVERALAAGTHDLQSQAEQIGVLMISDVASLATMRTVAAGAARGRVSPLRFAGAGPGTLAGLPCLTWGLRGPSLTLTSPPPEALEPAVVVVTGWLRRGQAALVVLGAHQVGPGGEHTAGCAVVGLSDPADGRAAATLADLWAALRLPELEPDAKGPADERRRTSTR